MVKIRFVHLFETNNFVPQDFFLYVAEFVRKIEFLIFNNIFNNIFHDWNKNRTFYQKMVKIKNVDFLQMNNFTS